MKKPDKDTELLAKHIQEYLAKGNSIKKIEKGVSGDVKRRDGFTRRTIYRS
jgi:hypothetical protein